IIASCIHYYVFLLTVTTCTSIYTLSLHDALPISCLPAIPARSVKAVSAPQARLRRRQIWLRKQRQVWTQTGCRCFRSQICRRRRDRKSTRLNSNHVKISYAVFCLKKQTTYTNNKN